MSKKLRAAVGKELRDLLGESAPIEFQDALSVDLMALGDSRGKSNARVISEQVMDMARKGDKWAIDFIADRTEGKAAQAVKVDEGDRALDEALNDVTIKHLNELAHAINAADPVGANPLVAGEDRGGDGDGAGAAQRAAGTASPLLDLPEDGDRDTEDPGSEPPMA